MNVNEIGRAGLLNYLDKQLNQFFPDGRSCRSEIDTYLDGALCRLNQCINEVKVWTPDQFDYLHSSQYCTFLYFLSNTMHRGGVDKRVCTKLFLLNKALNAIDLFYEIEMPDVFFIGHSVGIVLAKADYANYLVLYQNSTVGKNHGIAPKLEEAVIMYPNTAIIGDCHVKARSVIAQGVSVINKDTMPNSYVFQSNSGALEFKPCSKNILGDIFRHV